MVVCVIPLYRAAETIAAVVEAALLVVDHVVVVDDCCSEESGIVVETRFSDEPRVEVLKHQSNRGVGAATKTGIRRAFQLGATYVVKLDADGQMDPLYVPEMIVILQANPRLAIVKGNRFSGSAVVRMMPGIRLLGNSLLTLLVRITTGYWNGIDPTNGFIAMRAETLRRIDLSRLNDRYYFEISLLTELGLRRFEIADYEMPARYGAERSNLAISAAIGSFPIRLARAFARRLLWQYVVSDMNVGSLFLVAGLLLSALGSTLGAYWWAEALLSGVARTPGTVTVVLVPLIFGFQLLLNAILFDVQSAPRVFKFAHQEHGARDSHLFAARPVRTTMPRS